MGLPGGLVDKQWFSGGNEPATANRASHGVITRPWKASNQMEAGEAMEAVIPPIPISFEIPFFFVI